MPVLPASRRTCSETFGAATMYGKRSWSRAASSPQVFTAPTFMGFGPSTSVRMRATSCTAAVSTGHGHFSITVDS